jgi:nucleotide-binding universal stress UspA family protein
MSDEILLGYDGSDGAKHALSVAVELAKKLDRKLVLVFAYDVWPVGGETLDLAASIHEHGETVLAEGAAAASDQGIEPELVIEHADSAEGLAHAARERGASMIVVGTRGNSTLKGLVLGSVSHKLLHLSEVPVLVVPAESS